MTAYDAYDNVKTDYDGAGVALVGLHNSPAPGNYPPNLGGYAPDYGTLTWGSGTGVGTLSNVVDKDAETTALTISAAPLASPVSSSSVTVKPAVLDHFVWTQQPPVASSPTAGVAFGAEVTAYDVYDNVKTDYTGGATLSGLHNSPAAVGLFSGHPGNLPPSYGTLTWGSGTGVGTLSGVVDKDAETTTLVLTNTSPSVIQASSSFTVKPASPDALRFTEQPTEAAPSAVIHGTTSATTPVKVQAIDPFANLASNTSVKVAIGANPGPGATLGGTTTQGTDSTGTATFTNLTISKVGVGYTLVATSPPTSPTATQTSIGFTIAQSVGTCPGGTCSGVATITNQSTLNVNATGTTTSNTLGVALAPTTIPVGCALDSRTRSLRA